MANASYSNAIPGREIQTASLGEVYFSREMDPAAANQLLERGAIQAALAFEEPGVRDACTIGKEQQAIDEAKQLLMDRRAELGLPRTLPPTVHLLSELTSYSGYAGLADPELRVCRRYPALDYSEHPLLVGTLWTHEIAHAAGVLCADIDERASGEPEVLFLRAGCRIWSIEEQAWQFSAFEELAASAYERDFARAYGYDETRVDTFRAIDSSPLLRKPADFDDRGYGRKLMLIRCALDPASSLLEPALPHDGSRGSFYTVSSRVIEQGDFSIHSVYSQLIDSTDSIAEVLYDSPAGAKLFREDIQRIQGGAPHHLVTDRIVHVFGARGVEFFASLGSVDYYELFSDSYQIALLDVLNHSLKLPELERAAAQEMIFDLNDAYIRWQRKQKSDPELRPQRVQEAVRKAISHIWKADFKTALDELDHAHVKNLELRDDQIQHILSVTRSNRFKLPKSAEGHLLHRGIINREQLAQFHEQIALAYLDVPRFVAAGAFEDAANLMIRYALDPRWDPRLADALYEGARRRLGLCKRVNEVRELAEFCEDHDLFLGNKLTPGEPARLRSITFDRDYWKYLAVPTSFAAIAGVFGITPSREDLHELGIDPGGVASQLALHHPETFARWHRRRVVSFANPDLPGALAEGIQIESWRAAKVLGLPARPLDPEAFPSPPERAVNGIIERVMLRLELIPENQSHADTVREYLEDACERLSCARMLSLTRALEAKLDSMPPPPSLPAAKLPVQPVLAPRQHEVG